MSAIKEAKRLKKAIGMIGMNISEQQAALVIAFDEILDRKGQDVTIGDIELISNRIQGEYDAKQKVISLSKGGQS